MLLSPLVFAGKLQGRAGRSCGCGEIRRKKNSRLGFRGVGLHQYMGGSEGRMLRPHEGLITLMHFDQIAKWPFKYGKTST